MREILPFGHKKPTVETRSAFLFSVQATILGKIPILNPLKSTSAVQEIEQREIQFKTLRDTFVYSRRTISKGFGVIYNPIVTLNRNLSLNHTLALNHKDQD